MENLDGGTACIHENPGSAHGLAPRQIRRRKSKVQSGKRDSSPVTRISAQALVNLRNCRGDLPLRTEFASGRFPVEGVSGVSELLQPGARGIEASRALRLQEIVEPRARVNRGTILPHIANQAYQLDLGRGLVSQK